MARIIKIIVKENTRRFYREGTYIHNFMLLKLLNSRLKKHFDTESELLQLLETETSLKTNFNARKYVICRTREITLLDDKRKLWNLDLFELNLEFLQKKADHGYDKGSKSR